MLLQAYKCTFFASVHGHEINVSEVLHAVIYGGGQASHQTVAEPDGKQRSIFESVALGASHASVSNIFMDFTMQLTLGANRPVSDGHAIATLDDHHAVTFAVDTAAEYNANLTVQSKTLGKVAALPDSPNLYGENHLIATPKRCNCPFDCRYCCSCCWRCINFCSACWIVETSMLTLMSTLVLLSTKLKLLMKLTSIIVHVLPTSPMLKIILPK